MAILQKIRNKSVFLLIIVGLALMAFIIGDALQNGSSYFYSSKNQVAEINGNAVSIKEYRDLLNNNIELAKAAQNATSIEENLRYQIEEQTWQEIINANVLHKEFENLGIAVTDDEIAYLINSTQDAIIKQFFQGATKQQILNWVAYVSSGNAKPQELAQWTMFKKAVRNQYTQQKYFSIIRQGIKYPQSFINQFSEMNNKQVDIQYITKSYAAIQDENIKIEESEIDEYYNKYKDNFVQKIDERKIEYIIFPVFPSKNDFEITKKKVEDYKSTLSNKSERYKRFVNRYSDIPYDDNYYNKNQIEDENIASFAFSEKKGSVYGPELEDDIYVISKIIGVKRLPDSVRVRHILIGFNNRNLQQAEVLADSVEKLLKKPRARFTELAKEFSDDQNSAINGGDLGWVGPFEVVKAFSDTIFNARKWKIKRVTTNYGIHIVQVTKKSRLVKKVQLATIKMRVSPSQKTHEKVWTDASLFIERISTYSDFKNICAKENKQITTRIINNSTKELPALKNSNEIIKQSFRASKPNTILTNYSNSPIFELEEKYIIGYLTEISNKGHLPQAKVSSQIKNKLLKEKKFKYIADELQPSITANNSLEELSEKTGLKIHEASNITFTSSYVEGLGFEPSVVTSSIMLDEGDISNTIKGNKGVYIVKVDQSHNISEEIDIVDKNITTMFNRNPQYEFINIYQSLLDEMDIVDNRYNF